MRAAILALADGTTFVGRAFGATVDIGRWNDDSFAVKLFASKEETVRMFRDLNRRISGAYVCMEDGARHTLNVKVHVGLTDYQRSEDGDEFLAKADQLSVSLL